MAVKLWSIVGLSVVVAGGTIVSLKKYWSGQDPVPSLSSAFADNPSEISVQFMKFPLETQAAAYSISIGGIPVGVAVATQHDETLPGPTHFEMKLANRIGSSYVVTALKTSFSESDTEKQNNISGDIELSGSKGAISKSTISWLVRPNTVTLEKGDLGYLKSLGFSKTVREPAASQIAWDENSTLLFYKPKNKNISRLKMFFPHTGAYYTPEEIQARFDEDGFISEASVPWVSGMNFEFKRVNIEGYLSTIEAIRKTPVDLAWFSSEKGIREDLKVLLADAETSGAFAKTSENFVIQKLPQVPYVFHRKISNYINLTNRIVNVLGKMDANSSVEVALDKIIQPLRTMVLESKQELPYSLVNSPEWNVLHDDSKKSQWPKILSSIVRKTRDEIQQTLALEQSQKIGVTMRVNVEKMRKQSVIKARLVSKEMSVKVSFEPASDSVMKLTSWTKPPVFSKPVRIAEAKGKVPLEKLVPAPENSTFEFINGQSFAEGSVIDIGAICRAWQGKVGLDLGDAPQQIFRTDIVRGTWDLRTRVDLVREFARRAAALADCQQIIFRGPKDFETQIQKEIENFKRTFLQVETNFQISNGFSKRLRLVPGTYEITLNSVVTGSLLGRQDIQVPEGKDSNILVHLN